MKLTVSGKHSLQKLEELAVSLFSQVKNTEVVVPYLGDPALPYT